MIIASKRSYRLNEPNRELYSKCYNVDVTKNGADKHYSSNQLCPKCMKRMRIHVSEGKPLYYSSPAIWNQPNFSFKPHAESCYVCLSTRPKLFGNEYEYPIQSNVIPAVRNSFFDAPCSPPKTSRKSSTEESSDSGEDNSNLFGPKINHTPVLFDQEKLNQLVADLGLKKDSSEKLASRLFNMNLLMNDCKVSYYRTRHQEIVKFFEEHNGIPYLNNIQGLFDWLNIDYKIEEWRLLIDSSKSALKCVLLHNGNKLPSIPLLYSPTLTESYGDIKWALDLIGYANHKWKVIADLKLLNLMVGIGSSSSKHPCVLCDWQGTYRSNKHHLQYHQSGIGDRTTFNIGEKSCVNTPLIDFEHVLLPPLHVKIGLIAQFIKQLSVDGPAFAFLNNLLCYKSDAKIKAGQLNGPEIRKLLKHSDEFLSYLSPRESRAFKAFKSIVENFLGKTRSPDYKSICKELVDSYYEMKCNMSYMLHIIDAHIDRFEES